MLLLFGTGEKTVSKGIRPDVFCPGCGQYVELSDAFCSGCGQKL